MPLLSWCMYVDVLCFNLRKKQNMANIPKLRTHQKKWPQTKKTWFPQFPPTSPSTLNPNQFHSVLSQWTTSLLDCQWTRSAVTMTFQIYRSVGTSDLHLGPRTQISNSLKGQIFRSSFGGHTYWNELSRAHTWKKPFQKELSIIPSCMFQYLLKWGCPQWDWNDVEKYKHFKKI